MIRLISHRGLSGLLMQGEVCEWCTINPQKLNTYTRCVLGDQPWYPLCRASGGYTDYRRQSSHQGLVVVYCIETHVRTAKGRGKHKRQHK